MGESATWSISGGNWRPNYLEDRLQIKNVLDTCAEYMLDTGFQNKMCLRTFLHFFDFSLQIRTCPETAVHYILHTGSQNMTKSETGVQSNTAARFPTSNKIGTRRPHENQRKD